MSITVHDNCDGTYDISCMGASIQVGKKTAVPDLASGPDDTNARPSSLPGGLIPNGGGVYAYLATRPEGFRGLPKPGEWLDVSAENAVERIKSALGRLDDNGDRVIHIRVAASPVLSIPIQDWLDAARAGFRNVGNVELCIYVVTNQSENASGE